MTPPAPDSSDLDEVTDAMLLSSRVLLAVASRSVAAVDGSVTLPQFRALVVLEQGDRNVSELAHELRVQPSTATRLCDRLVNKRLVRRSVDSADRREVTISLSKKGSDLVQEVTARRRREIATIMKEVPAEQRSMIVEALTLFRDAAGEDTLVPSVPW